MEAYIRAMKYKKSEILLVEDDLALGTSISEILTLSDFEVHWFTDGLKALDYLQDYTPDIIISDLMMPFMDGEALFTDIRKKKKFNAIPFIIITANIAEEVKYRQLENGVNDYIMKPFKSKELIFKIKNILALRNHIERKYKPDPFSKVTINLSQKDFLVSINDYILDNLKSKIVIEDLSSHLFISKSTLDKKIRKLANKNTTQYIREFKLDYAIKLIDLGESNIQFLVDETGFKSFSYFSTSFKFYVGLTTRDYIKSLKN
jgi:DNA-binding response OmpR family regulator